MSIKNELILSYIKDLEPGTKISVRRLSDILDVSVGTVYKAIKTAEAQGLVVTKPKSGTFRVDAAVAGETEPMNLKRIAKLLGLTVIVEPSDAARGIERIIVCDGSCEQIRQALSGTKDNGGVLCMVGDRRDVHELVAEMGANLLLTSGANAEPLVLIRAERKGLCVISALQDTCTVMMLMDKAGVPVRRDTDEAQAWMKMPAYLYANDVVADWHNLRENITPSILEYPVVDENLRICGAIDANDVLRYFMFSGGGGSVPTFESFLERADIEDKKEEKYYNIRIPKSGRADPSEFTLPVVLTAALRHAEALLGEDCVIESGTFFVSKSLDRHESLMLSSKLTRRGEEGCTLEEEIFDDSCSYTKAILMFTAKQGE